MNSVSRFGVLQDAAARILLWSMIASTLIEREASAQNVPLPRCAVGTPQWADTATPTGFPADRIYIHSKHPQLCVDPTDKSCDATSYVLVGDSVKISADCSGWTFIEFDGKKKKTTGWVATNRVAQNEAGSVIATESPPPSKHSVCLSAERAMNASLRNPDSTLPALPSALKQQITIEKLPNSAVDQDYGSRWNQKVADIAIQEHPLKAITYGAGGTCHDDYLELWDPAFSHRVTVPSSNADADENASGYSSEDLVTLDGQPYFAHYNRYGEVTLTDFDKDLATHAVCEVKRVKARPEPVLSEAEPALCKAVASGSVQGVPVQEIEPYELSPESFGFNADGLARVKDLRNGLTIVARGKVDLDNDGKLDDVGLLKFGNGVDSAGCGHDVDTVVPIKLNPDGTPAKAAAAAAFNLAMIETAGAGESGRLFAYQGKVYFETESDMNADGGLTHIVSALSASGRRTMCALEPIEFKAVDAN